jgi:hypothetical protein
LSDAKERRREKTQGGERLEAKKHRRGQHRYWQDRPTQYGTGPQDNRRSKNRQQKFHSAE